MVLHSVMYWQSDTTGGGTEKQVTNASDWDPAGEYEVQERNGLPTFIGWDSFSLDKARVAAATTNDYHKLTMNTWEKADIMYQFPRAGFNSGSDPTTSDACVYDMGVQWFAAEGMNPVPLARDADFEVYTAATTANAVQAGVLYQSYGGAVRPSGGKIIGRLLDGVEAGAAPAFGAATTITDLDPRVRYRLHGITALSFEENDKSYGAVKITVPTMNTQVVMLAPALGSTENYPCRQHVLLPYDSVYIDGVETVSVSTAASAASKIGMIVLFQEVSGAGSGMGGGASGAGPIAQAPLFQNTTGANPLQSLAGLFKF